MWIRTFPPAIPVSEDFVGPPASVSSFSEHEQKLDEPRRTRTGPNTSTSACELALQLSWAICCRIRFSLNHHPGGLLLPPMTMLATEAACYWVYYPPEWLWVEWLVVDGLCVLHANFPDKSLTPVNHKRVRLQGRMFSSDPSGLLGLFSQSVMSFWESRLHFTTFPCHQTKEKVIKRVGFIHLSFFFFSTFQLVKSDETKICLWSHWAQKSLWLNIYIQV